LKLIEFSRYIFCFAIIFVLIRCKENKSFHLDCGFASLSLGRLLIVAGSQAISKEKCMFFYPFQVKKGQNVDKKQQHIS